MQHKLSLKHISEEEFRFKIPTSLIIENATDVLSINFKIVCFCALPGVAATYS